MSGSQLKGRFAPSPTGRMHAGNIFAALMSWLIVKSSGGEIVLRIEDLDKERSKQVYIDAIQHDFEYLGLFWDEGPYFQHDRAKAYVAAYNELECRDLLYPCYCTRADLHTLSAPHFGEKQVYPGWCRNLNKQERAAKESSGRRGAMRLKVPDKNVSFCDLIQGSYQQNLAKECGDFLVRRSDGEFAYQLAVVLDDAAQGINMIVRGVDLVCSTPQQIYLQSLFGFETPTYAHVPLLVSQANRRLSKRDHDASLDALLTRFKTPQAIIGHIAYISGLIDNEDPIWPSEILKHFDTAQISSKLIDCTQIPWH